MGRSLYSLLVCLAVLSVGKQIAIEFGSQTDYQDFAQNFGLSYRGPVGILDHIHLFETLNGTDDAIQFIQSDSMKRNAQYNIKWSQKQVLKKREKRDLDILDPLYPNQWHLHGSKSTHLNVQPAWSQGFMGEGVRIAIVDDGIQSTHPDVSKNVRLESCWNFNKDVNSPDPTYMKGPSGDWHGTASAGAAAANNDGLSCGVGVAPHAELAGIAILQNNAEVGDAIEAKALSFMPQHNHIYSNSWGPIRPGTGKHANEKPGPLLEAAIKKTMAEGRGGLGSIYVWAAGNDGGNKDNCNYDGYASMRYSVLVGSTDNKGEPSSYSEPCSAMLAVAPGGLISSNKIVTTDLMGADGLDTRNDCTAYSGTSASCPLAAGIVAILLQVNPNVTWLELQYILVEATQKHSDHGSWKKNAAGFWHSNNMGFGLLDAEKIVSTALRWKKDNIKVHEVVIESASDKNTITSDSDLRLHHVEVDVWASASVHDSQIELISPSGTVSLLATPHEDRLSKWEGWTFLTRMFHGETAKGDWVLKVTVNGQESGLTKWNIRIYANDNATEGEGIPSKQPPVFPNPNGESARAPDEEQEPEPPRAPESSSYPDFLTYIFLPGVVILVLVIKRMSRTEPKFLVGGSMA